MISVGYAGRRSRCQICSGYQRWPWPNAARPYVTRNMVGKRQEFTLMQRSPAQIGACYRLFRFSAICCSPQHFSLQKIRFATVRVARRVIFSPGGLLTRTMSGISLPHFSHCMNPSSSATPERRIADGRTFPFTARVRMMPMASVLKSKAESRTVIPLDPGKLVCAKCLSALA